jgi:hypothetical protein
MSREQLIADLRTVYRDWERLLNTVADKQLVARRQ